MLPPDFSPQLINEYPAQICGSRVGGSNCREGATKNVCGLPSQGICSIVGGASEARMS